MSGESGARSETAVPPEVESVARSIEWLAIAQMLVLFHGQDRAWKRLQELGCPFVPPSDHQRLATGLATLGKDGN